MFKVFVVRRAVSFILLALLACGATSSVWAYSDPTRPPGFGEQRSKKTAFKLNSILVSEGRKVAIINGKAVSEGERVSGAKVLSISKTVVKINQRGKILELKPKRVSIRREK